ncbi:MAG: MGMT family protein, partial [Leptolyngbyaceae cyanobacterium SU_3_3]|nr:MGMT family protein [Leptolyngbyaceae cyanobacterium SU_3_3]
TSYGAIANAIGSPKAVRAVGAANGRNPIPIIIPCHRVIGANGSLTGFGAGWIARKLSGWWWMASLTRLCNAFHLKASVNASNALLK